MRYRQRRFGDKAQKDNRPSILVSHVLRIDRRQKKELMEISSKEEVGLNSCSISNASCSGAGISHCRRKARTSDPVESTSPSVRYTIVRSAGPSTPYGAFQPPAFSVFANHIREEEGN